MWKERISTYAITLKIRLGVFAGGRARCNSFERRLDATAPERIQARMAQPLTPVRPLPPFCQTEWFDRSLALT